MNSICLSVAPNLRCQGLTRIENIVLLIPPAIELVFSLTLAFNNNNSSTRGWKRWILVLDGFTFFCLALADLLAHLLDEVTSTVNYFKIIDFVIAGASILPLLAYTLFLFLFARANLIKLLPDRFSRVANIALFFVIPPIIAFNELGSLLGISHAVFELPDQRLVLAVGFTTLTFQRISLFFSSGALALLTVFQAALFSLCFIRLVRAFLDERRSNAFKGEPQAPDEIHLFRGLGWLAAGLKLGAIETVVGFASTSFAIAITRRALRLFGRGMIIIGIIKGLNIVEDFVKFETDVLAQRNSSGRMKRISRLMISNPRNSTFREMSPRASSFHAAQSEKKKGRLGPSPLRLGAQSSFKRFDSVAEPVEPVKERVTVVYDGKTPPVLQMRFSAIDMEVHPLPPPQKAQLSTVMEDPREDHSSIYTSTSVPEALRPSYTRRPSYLSSMSDIQQPNQAIPAFTRSRPDITEAVHLPNTSLPHHTVPTPQQGPYTDADADWRRLTHNPSVQRQPQLNQAKSNSNNGQKTTDVSPVNSIKRKPPPILTPALPEYKEPITIIDDRSETQYALFRDRRSSIYSSEEGTEYDVELRAVGSRAGTPGLTRHSTLETVLETPAALGVRGGPAYEASPRRSRARPVARETTDAQAAYHNVAAVDDRRQRRLLQLRRTLGAQSSRNEGVQEEETKSRSDMGASWLHMDPLSNLQALGSSRDPRNVDIEEEDVSEAVLDEAWQRAGLTRLKSVNRVPVHTTPKVEQSFDVRSSMFAVEEDDLGFPASPEDVRRVSVMSASLRRPARLDSGVLGEEEKRLVRQGIQV